MLKYASLGKKNLCCVWKEINTAEFQTTQTELYFLTISSYSFKSIHPKHSFYTTFQRQERASNIEVFRKNYRFEKISPVSLTHNVVTWFLHNYFFPIKNKKEQNVRNQIEKLPLLSNPDGSVVGFFPELCHLRSRL